MTDSQPDVALAGAGADGPAMSRQAEIAQVAARLAALPAARHLVAVAGPPGAGKSTLAEALSAVLGARGRRAVVVPMDGFHLDNRVLDARGLRPRKGAPQTFDAEGFVHLVGRIAAGEPVYCPVFDRERDISIAGAAEVTPQTEFVIFEGNYLLCDVPPWDRLLPVWSFTIFLDPGRETIAERLLARWRAHGLPEAQARARRDANDMPNADFVRANGVAADLTM